MLHLRLQNGFGNVEASSMPSVEVELTRDSVLKQFRLGFSQTDARAHRGAWHTAFLLGKTAVFSLLLCALHLFSDSFSHPTVPSSG